jgi:hypothetical protein
MPKLVPRLAQFQAERLSSSTFLEIASQLRHDQRRKVL